MSLFKRLRNRAALTLLPPYLKRELPGWGRLYQAFVGDYKSNADWKGYDPIWIRGRVHGYEMLLDLGSWTNRQTYFIGRYFDIGNQLVMQAVLAKGDTFVDIGANEGMISLTAASLVGEEGKVIAFEPNPGPRAIFEKAIARNAIRHIDLRPVGLSDEPGSLPLTVPEVNSGEGSFARPAYGADQMSVVTCAVHVGDDELNGETPRLIKIDVEGFELHVMKGLQETVMRARPIIVMEMIAGHLANAGTSAEEISDYMAGLGYQGFQMKVTGRAAEQRVRLTAPQLTPDLWTDFLWIHPQDPLAESLPQRLANTAPF